MPGRIFVSCGQADAEERSTAAAVKIWLESQGFNVFVALETQSLNDINSGTIGELQRSDYYLFIDFPRERVLLPNEQLLAPARYRGSVFTHQELAIAYQLNFPDAIFLKNDTVELRGIAQFQMANAATFAAYSEVLPLVQQHVTERNWSPSYSRHLVAENGHWNSHGVIKYRDHTGEMNQKIYHVAIANRRSDVGAFYSTARLSEITFPDKTVRRSPDLNDIKWSGQSGYARTIRPTDTEQIDALALAKDAPAKVYLHSAADVHRTPVLSGTGVHLLQYQVYSQGFPLLEFQIRLNLTGALDSTTAELITI